MRFPFNERKTAQAAAYLITLNNGKLNLTVLLTLLLLADRITLVRHGQPITGSVIMSMSIGPVLTDVLPLLNELNPKKSPWKELVPPPENNEVSLQSPNPPVDELSRFEMNTLESVLQEHGGKSPDTLTAWLHANTPEWTYPQHGMSTIDPEDILRSQGVPEPTLQDYREGATTLMALSHLGVD